ncbi:MAG: hypothetical protein MZV49_12705 [Rhodopseudomonas palustris]|nr:hypothetical protein [Rhodopseudomonas palustris]
MNYRGDRAPDSAWRSRSLSSSSILAGIQAWRARDLLPADERFTAPAIRAGRPAMAGVGARPISPASPR